MSDRVALRCGPELGDELRRQAESLAYRAALDFEQALRRIESHLAASALAGWNASDRVEEQALDIIRRHMVRGLYRAQLEAGESAVFWRVR
jgi:hypothetical protein